MRRGAQQIFCLNNNANASKSLNEPFGLTKERLSLNETRSNDNNERDVVGQELNCLRSLVRFPEEVKENVAILMEGSELKHNTDQGSIYYFGAMFVGSNKANKDTQQQEDAKPVFQTGVGAGKV